MLKINIICVGSLKEAYLRDAAAEYLKRLSRYAKITVTEAKEARLPANASRADEEAVKNAEGAAILGKIGVGPQYVIALDVRGESLSSERFARRIRELSASGTSSIAFIIGGSLGLSDDVLQAADFRLSFSPMTFPHQLMRVILLEQIYRAGKINSGESYHK
ncbi:MAG: 23S rRNA (pseudouridine(1915)-N(3))-methyltransferase RlmH [Clostridiales Family XIII bacterium]|jgi:23S rRNA (pseudouridine1915-N3)-methyltransferase|nr:23S rRNA (pseudouridine(1915)-N(3))-methyltransferase RlmH [Clostridiales Family XIII bacterium]